jgi:hypothetical protein
VTRALLFAAILATILVAAPTARAAAQSAPGSADTTAAAARTDSDGADVAPDTMSNAGSADRPERGSGECYRFMFGEWSPPLDAKAAGHAPFPPDASLPHAPGGRDWAFSDSTVHDMQLMLYPSFWPAGVNVRFSHAPRTPRDTVHGRAFALVADGRVQSPEADALAWLVPCRR